MDENTLQTKSRIEMTERSVFYMLTAQCPFYKFERGGKVYCECGVVKFKCRRHRVKFMGEYCANLTGHLECSLAKEMYEEYERIELKRTE